MYKVFINDSSLEFVPNHPENQNVVHWKERDRLEEWIERMETTEEVAHYALATEDPEELWTRFMSFYKHIDAAGGVVRNKLNEILMIYRLGKWDLPKGKLEGGESVEEGAMREVIEECGITQLEIIKALPATYHTYFINGQRVLKRTYWFTMRTDHHTELVPQREEQITEAQWVKPDRMPQYLENTYASIRWLLQQTDF